MRLESNGNEEYQGKGQVDFKLCGQGSPHWKADDKH